jgi:M6 family metalloprotease-like protein
MRIYLAIVSSALLLVVGFAPASAATKYSVNQKTLATFGSSATGLTGMQKSQIQATVEANPNAEKFICTGIRYYSQPMSVNIMVRKRAKAACEYAKLLNPSLSTWYQNKPTQARSYAGKVLLTVKTDAEVSGLLSAGYADTEAIPVMPFRFTEGEPCAGATHGSPVVGFLKNGNPGFISCHQLSVWRKAEGAFAIDPVTRKPLVPALVPSKSVFSTSPMVYITPQVSDARPQTALSPEDGFNNIAPCRLVEADTSGRPHMVSGFPMAANRAIMDSEVIVQVIPVDFADYRSGKPPGADIADVTKAVADFWSRMSDGKTKITWRVPSTYYNLPKKAAEYNLSGVFPNFVGDSYDSYVEAAVAASDSDINFSDVDIVLISHAPETPKNTVGTFIAQAGMPGSEMIAKTSEKIVYNTLIQGADWPRNTQNWIHEFGHMLGLTDGGFSGNMGFDVMLHYGNAELTVWNRFVLGIESDSQIHCKTDADTSTHLVSPVAWPGQRTEGIVIPLSSSKAIVVESRRRTGYDALLGKESEGALVYEVDTSGSGNFGDGPFTTLAPDRMTVINEIWSIDAPLKNGESISHAGWTITVKETGAYGDVIEVKKG